MSKNDYNLGQYRGLIGYILFSGNFLKDQNKLTLPVSANYNSCTQYNFDNDNKIDTFLMLIFLSFFLVQCVNTYRHHSMCGSNKLLYKRCVLNRKKAIFDPPQLRNLGSDRPETQTLETSPWDHPTCQMWLRSA